MTIQITRPELEALIQQRLHSGGFESIEDVLFDALEMQQEREVWLLEKKAVIQRKSNEVWTSSIAEKAYPETGCARVSMPIRWHGWQTALVHEGVSRRARS